MNPPILANLQQVGSRPMFHVAASCVALALSCGSALAANGTWVGNQSTANGDWSNSANWSGGTIPGVTSGTTNQDTATINNAVSGLNTKGIISPIVIDSGRNIKTLSFTSDRGGSGVTTTGAFSGTTGYTVGTTSGPALTLSDAGLIAIYSNFIGVGITEAVNAPLSLAGSVTFSNATLPSQNNLLSLGGDISRLSSGASVINLRGMGNGQITGNILNGSGTLGLVQYSTGTWTLSGANSFSDGVAVRSGTMILNHTTNNSAKISGALNLGRTTLTNSQGAGGTLQVLGNSSAATSESVSSTTLGAGASTISVTSGSNQNASLNLGTLTRSRGSTANFVTTNTGTGISSLLASYSGSANGIMGAWAVKNSQDWASLSGGEIVAYSAYSDDTWASGSNTNITQSGSVSSATTNTLRFNTAAPITLSLTGTNTIQSGGILVGSGVGANNVTISGGAIGSSSNTELILNQYNTQGLLSILSDIVLSGSTRTLVKAGEGTVVLGGNNTLGVSGSNAVLALESGTLRLGSSSALNSAFTDLQLGSITSQLDLNGYNATVNNLYSNNFEGKGITAAAQAAPKVSNLAAGTSSTLTVSSGATYNGTFSEASGAILNLAVTGGTFTLNGGPSNIGYGDVITPVPNNMFELLTGNINLSGSGTMAINKDLNIWGALNLNGASSRINVSQPMGVGYLSGTGVVNAAGTLFVNHVGSAADTFSGTFLAAALNKIYVGGTGTLEIPTIVTSIASNANGGSSIRVSGAATLITPGLTTSGSGSNWSVRLTGESTLKVTGTSGVVIGTGVATNATGVADQNAGLQGGTLWIAPSGSGANVSVSGLTAQGDATTGAAMFYQNGSTVILDRGQNQSLTFTLGNTANTFVRNGFQRVGAGTVVIAATDGLSRTAPAGLGTTERLQILGSGAALPVVTNGMVSASIVGQDNDANKSGDFLTYEGTGTTSDVGYRAFDYSGANGLVNTLTGADYTKVAKFTNTNASITSGTTGLYALRLDNSTMSVASGASLRLGAATSALGGLILNGGTIDGDGSLLIPTGANGELAVYTSLAGGTISATIGGGGTTQSGGFTKFGEGTLLVTKAMTYTFGYTSLNEGVLDLNGFALPTNTALRLQGGVLQSSGTFVRGLVSSDGGVMIVNGGGFAARGGAYDIAIGGLANPTKLTWGESAGANNFNGVLIFGSTTADNVVTFRNAIDLGVGVRNGYFNNYSSESMRVVRVVDNVNSANDRAVLSGVISSTSPYQGLAKDGDGELYLTAANTYTGPTAITKGKLWVGADNNLGAAPSAAYDIIGTPTPGAVVINGGATLGLYNSFTLSSARSLLLASGATGATASRVEVSPNQTVTFNGQIGNYINEVGSLEKTGAGVLILGGMNEYTGTTKVSAGTLVVNGSIASSSGVEVASGASLGGRGTVGAISGAGLIGPGNSPGILTGTNVNASAGLDFAFEFTLANAAPNYGSASSPGNDVLRLTSATPFSASLNTGNEVAIYLNLGSLTEGDVLYGGFYADSGDFFGSISGAKFTYYLADAGGAFSYGGVNYSLYTANEIQASTVAQTANFGQGSINGYVMQLEVVPEPSTWLLVGMGLFSVLIFRRRLARNGR